MDYNKLKAELTTGHPDTGAYDADAAVAAGQLNAVNRTRAIESVSGQAIFEAVDGTDFAGLSDADRTLLYAIIGMGTILVNGVNTKAALLAMFGPGTDTRANLAALQTEAISRAAELGLDTVYEGTVQQARAS